MDILTVRLPDMVNILLITMLQDGGHGSYPKVSHGSAGMYQTGFVTYCWPTAHWQSMVTGDYKGLSRNFLCVLSFGPRYLAVQS